MPAPARCRSLLVVAVPFAAALACVAPPARTAGKVAPLDADALWANLYASDGTDVLGGVARDDAGNVLVSWWDGALHAVRLEKRDPGGALVWERRFLVDGGDEGPSRMAVRALPGGAVELAVNAAMYQSVDLGTGPCSGGQRARLDADGFYLEGSLRPNPGASIEVVAANARGDIVVREMDAWTKATLVRADGTRVPLVSAYASQPAGALDGFRPVLGAVLDLYADGSVLAATLDGFVKLGPDGQLRWLTPFPGLSGSPLAVATLPDGSAVVAGSFSGGAAMWGDATLALHGIDPPPAAYVLAIAPDGTPGWAVQLDDAIPKALAARADRIFVVTGPDRPDPLALTALDAATGAVVATRTLGSNPFQRFGTYTPVGLAAGDARVVVGGTFSRPFDFGAGVVTPAKSDGYVLDLAL